METKTKNIQFRLPTRDELSDLIENHFTKWNKEKKGIEITNKKGDVLFFHAAGYHYGILNCSVGFYGYYWSSTMDERYGRNAFCLVFDSREKYIKIRSFCLNYEHTVRLVSDTPFEGGIEFNGIWWKPENEPGYYTFNEAIKLFEL